MQQQIGVNNGDCFFWRDTEGRVKDSKFRTDDAKCIFTDPPSSRQAIIEDPLFLC